VDEVEQGVDVVAAKAAAEVPGSRRVRETAGTQGVQEVLVLAAQLDVLEAGAVTEGVVSEVENVVRFMVGEGDLEDLQPLVDGLDEAEALRQGMDGPDATVADPVDTSRNRIVDVGRREQGSRAAADVGLVQAALAAALAVVQPPS